MTSYSNGHVPPGWSVARLDECVDVLDKARRPVNATERTKREGSVPYYGATGQVGWIDEPLFDEELLLLGEDGAPFLDKSKPIAYVIDGPSWVNNHAHVLRARPAVTSNRYLKYFLDSFDFSDRVGGSTRDKLTQRDMNSIPVLLAPAEQQLQIVRTLEEVGTRRTSIADRLAAAREIINRLRAAVLAAACSGRLTADWRQEHSDALEESAGSLPESVDTPATWVRCSLDEITTRITSGPRDWSGYYGRGSSTFVMAQNVRPGEMDWSFRQAVDPPAGDPSRRRCQIEKGDILVTIVGANTGDAAPVMDERPEHFVCQSVALVRPTRLEDSPFLSHWFCSPAHGRGYFDECIYGAGRPHLSFEQLKRAAVALPPVDEQREIAARTADALRIVDGLEVGVHAAEARLKNATDAALGRAFRGEVVPTDAELADVSESAPAGDGDLKLEAERLESLG